MKSKASFLILAFCVAAGCSEQAQSQEDSSLQPQRVNEAESEGLQDRISTGRQTAITRAVTVAAPAVVSINVIEVKRAQYRDPFADLLADPWFEQFFGKRRMPEYEYEVQGLGSGFVISSDGYVVTNHHVAGNAVRITVSFADGNTMPARLVGSDAVSDIALLKVETASPVPFLSFSETDPLVGEWAIALGNPFGLFDANEPTVTVGVVSAVNRDFEPREGTIYRDMIQTDASINRGNSGGPLINALGEVIGVNTAIVTAGTGGSIGLGFAIPAVRALRIAEELQETGQVDRSYYTGLRGDDVTARIARALGLSAAAGVFVRDVDPDSPAAEAGFQPYDVIVELEDESIGDRADFAARLYDFRPGDRVHVGLIREGRRVDLDMTIGRARG